MSELINKLDATTIPVMPKEYRKYQTMNLDDAYEQGWNDLQRCIENLPSAEPHWIPVSERLPEENQMCLVCDKGYIGIDTYLGHGGIFEWKIYVKNYDAWMPMPEPYNGGEQE